MSLRPPMSTLRKTLTKEAAETVLNGTRHDQSHRLKRSRAASDAGAVWLSCVDSNLGPHRIKGLVVVHWKRNSRTAAIKRGWRSILRITEGTRPGAADKNGKGETIVPLTVKDILEKTFKRSFKGYDEDEVDKFLDMIIDEFKQLQTENASLKEALISRKRTRGKNQGKPRRPSCIRWYPPRKHPRRIVNEAARKAELILDNAESTAKQPIGEDNEGTVAGRNEAGGCEKQCCGFCQTVCRYDQRRSGVFRKAVPRLF